MIFLGFSLAPIGLTQFNVYLLLVDKFNVLAYAKAWIAHNHMFSDQQPSHNRHKRQKLEPTTSAEYVQQKEEIGIYYTNSIVY